MREILAYECEMCLNLAGKLRTGAEAFLGYVCDDCYEAVMSQGDDE